MCSRVTTSLRAPLDTGGVGGVNSSAAALPEALFTPMPSAPVPPVLPPAVCVPSSF
jgi:hypothetical protein